MGILRIVILYEEKHLRKNLQLQPIRLILILMEMELVILMKLMHSLRVIPPTQIRMVMDIVTEQKKKQALTQTIPPIRLMTVMETGSLKYLKTLIIIEELEE